METDEDEKVRVEQCEREHDAADDDQDMLGFV